MTSLYLRPGSRARCMLYPLMWFRILRPWKVLPAFRVGLLHQPNVDEPSLSCLQTVSSGDGRSYQADNHLLAIRKEDAYSPDSQVPRNSVHQPCSGLHQLTIFSSTYLGDSYIFIL